MAKKTYKICQSCGMPLKRDPQRGGTEADDVLRAMRTKYDKKEFEVFFRKAMAIALLKKRDLTKQ